MNCHACFAGLGLSLVLVTGCCHLASSSRPFPHRPLPAALAGEIAETNSGAFLTNEIFVQTNHAIVMRRLELELTARQAGSNHVIAVDCFLPKKTNSPSPVVLVMAVSGGHYKLEHHVANYFARHGFAAIVIRRPESDRSFTTGEQINNLLKLSVQNDRRVVDWIETQPEFDSQRIVVFAVSLGAIQSVMFVSSDQRVRAAVLGLVGGDVADILTHTREKSYVKRRAALLDKEHLTLDEFEQKFSKEIQCDPIYFGPYVPRDKVMLVLARFDHIVPYRNGRELREKMGDPETIFILSGHLTAVLYLPYLEHEALEFYHRHFASGVTAN